MLHIKKAFLRQLKVPSGKWWRKQRVKFREPQRMGEILCDCKECQEQRCKLGRQSQGHVKWVSK